MSNFPAFKNLVAGLLRGRHGRHASGEFPTLGGHDSRMDVRRPFTVLEAATHELAGPEIGLAEAPRAVAIVRRVPSKSVMPTGVSP